MSETTTPKPPKKPLHLVILDRIPGITSEGSVEFYHLLTNGVIPADHQAIREAWVKRLQFLGFTVASARIANVLQALESERLRVEAEKKAKEKRDEKSMSDYDEARKGVGERMERGAVAGLGLPAFGIGT